ncbi:hypothetical protein [Devosia geojensis]|uniref:hypothetical protein n=1 Tax=Devosia geojensis TaxID=443610 RepID=UPI000AC5A736|nr:hypothetical protein [Devosia geojensis]
MNKTVRNERRKLSANYANGIAIALVAIGGLGPVIAVVQDGTLSWITIGLATICIA